MPKSLKIITIIGVLCMLVPFMVLGSFASAETVIQDGAVTVANSFYSSWILPETGNSRVFSFVFPESFSIGFSQFYPYPVPADLFFEFETPFDIDFSLNSSALVSLSINAVVVPAYFDTSTGNAGRININTTSEDGQLHMYMLLVAYLDVTQSGTSDLPAVDEWYFFDSRLLSDLDCQTRVVDFSFIPDDGYYLDVTMPDSSVAPSLNLHGFFNSTNPIFGSGLTFYAVTWYSTPGYHSLAPNTARIPPTSVLFSFSDVTVSGAGYSDGFIAGKQQGYDEGFIAGEQQGYEDGFDDGFTDGYDDGLAEGFDEGYDSGITAGKQQANNTVTQNSASYLQGYQDGLNAPDYSFMSLIASVFDAPIRALFGYTQDGVQHPGLFSIDILGMNMGAFIASIFSLAVILTVLRLVLGGKS